MQRSNSNPLSAHIPRYLLRLIGERGLKAMPGVPFRKELALLFCDVSGFTPLSETLSRHGKEGTEVLTEVLNDYFDSMITVIESWGGDVVKFGGDAVTVIFEPLEGETLAGAFRRAAACSVEVFEKLGGTRMAATPWGEFPLRLKIGASAGRCLAGVMGDTSSRLEHILAGTPLDRMAEAEHHAKPGWTVVDTRLTLIEDSGLRLEPLGEGFARLEGVKDPPSRPDVQSAVEVDLGSIRPFLLPAVWGQVESGTEALLSEHRKIATAFVAFPGLDYGDDGSLSLLNEYFKRVAAMLSGYGGSFNRMDMGDKGSKFLCFFGAPESHENNEERAVAFALRLRDIEKDLPWIGAQRAGVSSGMSYCGLMGSSWRKEYTGMGDTVNLAARLMGAAGEERILASEAVREATREKFHWGPYRSLTLKGKSAQVKASTPGWPQRRKRSRVLSRVGLMLGRDAELKSLGRALSAAARGGNNLLVLTGEAGIGKTALLESFLSRAANEGIRTMMVSCPTVSAGTSQIWGELFWNLVSDQDRHPRVTAEKWEELLPDQREFLCLCLRFLGISAPLSRSAEALDTKERQEKTVDLLVRTLRAIGKKTPLALALDDIHAAGPEARDLLAELSIRLKGDPVFLLASARPGFECGGRPKFLCVGKLSETNIGEVARAVLGAQRLPGALQEFLVERAGGNPLFLLEMLGDLKEREIISKDREGRVNFREEETKELPDSVEGLLLARIDRLPLQTRNILKVSSCLGMSFEVSLLESVFLPATPGSAICASLDSLSDLGLVRGEGSHGNTYTFGHASLRDTAYGAILIANRRNIHLRAGETLEARGGGANPDLLAFHFGEAGIPEKALHFALLAAADARQRFAVKEALGWYTRAKAFSDGVGGDLPTDGQLNMAECAIQTGDYDVALTALDRVLSGGAATEEQQMLAREHLLFIQELKGEYTNNVKQGWEGFCRFRHSEDRARALRFLKWHISALLRLGNFPETEEALILAHTLSEGQEFAQQRAAFEVLHGGLCYLRGDYANAVGHYSASLSWAESNLHYPLAMRAYIGLSNVARERGELEASADHARKALEHARRIGSRETIIGAGTTLATALNWLKRYDEALEMLEEIRPSIDEEKLPYAACSYLNMMGVVLYYSGKVKKAMTFYRKCKSLARKNQIGQWVPSSTYNVADALVTLGDYGAGLRQYQQALKEMKAFGDRQYFLQTLSDMRALFANESVPPELRRQHRARLARSLRSWGETELLAQLESSG